MMTLACKWSFRASSTRTAGGTTRSSLQAKVLFRPAGFEHANAAIDGISISLSLQLDAASAPEPIADWIKQTAPLLERDPHIGVLASRLSRELATPDGFSPAIIDAFCVELMVQLFRNAARDSDDPMPRLADEAADFIRDRLDDPLSIESVAKALGTDRFRLNRAFSRHKGTSPRGVPPPAPRGEGQTTPARNAGAALGHCLDVRLLGPKPHDQVFSGDRWSPPRALSPAAAPMILARHDNPARGDKKDEPLRLRVSGR